MPVTATERFAHFALELDAGTVPGEVRDSVSLHLLDVLGCGLAAVTTGAAVYARALGAAAEPGRATALGVPTGTDPAIAALANGITCHALDFDDTHPGSIAHVSAVVVPAALAAAQAKDAFGSDLVSALLAGNEITCRVGRLAGDAFHLRGFHPTAICGVFGATAAVARIRRLDEQRLTHALGIAGSMAAGLMAYLSDGAETKRVHAGWMAHAAHMAVALAEHGATGPSAVLEGRHGVYAAFVDRHDVVASDLVADLGTRWETPDIAFKPYPACHFLHAPLDALIALHDEHGFSSEEVQQITVLSPRAGIELVCEPAERKRVPSTAYESKFSAPFALAAWLHTGAVDAATFDEPLLCDPQVLALAAKVDHSQHDYETFPGSLPGGVRLTLVDGTVLERHLAHQRGGAANPMNADEVVAKYRANATLALDDSQVDELEGLVLGLAERLDISGFEVLGEATSMGSA